MQDSLGDRMKLYEKSAMPELLMPLLPTFARLDGKNFHNFCRGFLKPYDERMSECMTQLTLYLVKETNAKMGYTQSDEITLTWLSEDYKSQIFFNGKPQKMISILSAMTSVYFNAITTLNISETRYRKGDNSALFDCRVWTVPNIVEGANVFVWREQDATRNSIQSSARTYFSHKECENKSCSELQEMLHSKGINWNNYPSYFKRGTYINNIKMRNDNQVETQCKEFEQFKETYKDTRAISVIDMPVITTIENRAGVIYKGEAPLLIDRPRIRK